jgi:hypothetical protein
VIKKHICNNENICDFYLDVCDDSINMTQSYPLYDQLIRKVNDRNEKSIDIKRLCITINNIVQTQSSEDSSEHYREISALILHHELLANNGVLLSPIPYEGKVMTGGKGVLYNITFLPPILQQILVEYIEMLKV